jgi:hypothetical protein
MSDENDSHELSTNVRDKNPRCGSELTLKDVLALEAT